MEKNTIMGDKKCSKCNKKYPAILEYFYRDKSTKSGLMCYCKQCCKKYANGYNKDSNVKKHKRDYDKKYRQVVRLHLRVYGLTLAEYDQMFEVQDGICAICGRPETSKNQWGIKRLSVDHNHKTGKVRGLLCVACNSALGYTKEDIVVLSKMISYIQENF